MTAWEPTLIAGLSRHAKLSHGRCLTVGGFFDYGNGSYDTFNSFSNAADVHVRDIGQVAPYGHSSSPPVSNMAYDHHG